MNKFCARFFIKINICKQFAFDDFSDLFSEMSTKSLQNADNHIMKLLSLIFRIVFMIVMSFAEIIPLRVLQFGLGSNIKDKKFSYLHKVVSFIIRGVRLNRITYHNETINLV